MGLIRIPGARQGESAIEAQFGEAKKLRQATASDHFPILSEESSID